MSKAFVPRPVKPESVVPAAVLDLLMLRQPPPPLPAGRDARAAVRAWRNTPARTSLLAPSSSKPASRRCRRAGPARRTTPCTPSWPWARTASGDPCASHGSRSTACSRSLRPDCRQGATDFLTAEMRARLAQSRRAIHAEDGRSATRRRRGRSVDDVARDTSDASRWGRSTSSSWPRSATSTWSG